jgi:uncharacterized heparinase superfamily protein
MYHSLILEDLMDVFNILQAYGIENKDLVKHIHEMYTWMQNLVHPDNNISFFNDAVMGCCASLDELKNYADRIGINLPILLSGPTMVALTHSGFYRMQYNYAVVLIDAGDVGPSYNPGHAHAGTLSFELSLDRQRILVNSGISTYESTPSRCYERGTSAHNTLEVNNQNSSQVWKSFRVGYRAKIIHVSFDLKKNYLRATHSGYARMNVFHTREWQLAHNLLTITDLVEGNSKRDIKLYYHLHPDVEITSINERSVISDIGDKKILLDFECAEQFFLESVDTTFHPEFGLALKNKTIICHLLSQLPCKFLTKLSWN